MLWAKLAVQGLGEFWIETPPLRDNQQAEQWVEGLSEGWNLARSEPMTITDIRLSRHPVEPLYSLEKLKEFLDGSSPELESRDE